MVIKRLKGTEEPLSVEGEQKQLSKVIYTNYPIEFTPGIEDHTGLNMCAGVAQKTPTKLQMPLL